MGSMVTEQDYLDAAEELGVKIVKEEIQPGDLYLAGRNTGIHLLTCCENNKDKSWIVPVEGNYCYDTWECRKVIEI